MPSTARSAAIPAAGERAPTELRRRRLQSLRGDVASAFVAAIEQAAEAAEAASSSASSAPAMPVTVSGAAAAQLSPQLPAAAVLVRPSEAGEDMVESGHAYINTEMLLAQVARLLAASQQPPGADEKVPVPELADRSRSYSSTSTPSELPFGESIVWSENFDLEGSLATAWPSGGSCSSIRRGQARLQTARGGFLDEADIAFAARLRRDATTQTDVELEKEDLARKVEELTKRLAHLEEIMLPLAALSLQQPPSMQGGPAKAVADPGAEVEASQLMRRVV